MVMGRGLGLGHRQRSWLNLMDGSVARDLSQRHHLGSRGTSRATRASIMEDDQCHVPHVRLGIHPEMPRPPKA